MKKLLLVFLSFYLCFSYSQETAFFYITNGNDDGDEVFNNIPVLDRDYLKLGWSPDGHAIYTGLRFQNVTIPRGSEVLSAHIQFTASHDEIDTIYMKIKGELSPNATPITSEVGSISLRNMTGMSQTWITQNWQFFTPGPDQRTSNLNEIIEEIINQDGWISGNAMLFIFNPYPVNGEADTLMAMSYEYALGEWYAPQLIVEYINWADVQELSDSDKFSIYPNPASNKINIQSTMISHQTTTLEIFDLQGKKMTEKQIPVSTEEFEINVSTLQSGIYFCRLLVENKSISQKLVILK